MHMDNCMLFFPPAISIMFSSLPIEQYRSIAWFNVASGVLLLGLFGFFFHGEGSWKSINCCEMSVCSHKNKDVRPGPLQIFISYNIAIVYLWCFTV